MNKDNELEFRDGKLHNSKYIYLSNICKIIKMIFLY